MYKIYINETPLFLMPKQEALEANFGKPNSLIGKYTGKTKFLLNYIDMLEKSQRFDSVYLYAEDTEGMFRDFKALFLPIKAAGGVVVNTVGQTLMIYRRGFWDLPKGKIDPGEGKKEAAIREVQEETGLEELEIGKRLTHTLHTYKDRKGRRVLKTTYWYPMQSPVAPLKPQLEEDIEQAIWVDLPTFLQEGKKIYKSILDVLMVALQSGSDTTSPKE
ncbi:MAG: NUDIX domain-containing protein [Bacteroidota bacterium]